MCLTKLDNSIDEKLEVLKKTFDPLLRATDANYKKVKAKNGFEKMWLPLFIFYPFKQLVSLVSFGKYGMKVTKLQGITTGIIAAAPFLSNFITSIERTVAQLSTFQLGMMAFGAWYIFTVIYTFLQMPNWKNKDLFHIDAYRIFRPNEYALVEQLLGTNFSIESIITYLSRYGGNQSIIDLLKEESTKALENKDKKILERDKRLYMYEEHIVFLNELLVKLNENISFIANDSLSFDHLYLIKSPYCLYRVVDGDFELKQKEFPRVQFTKNFSINNHLFQEEPFVKCYLQEDPVFIDANSISYKILLEDGSTWIITYYPSLSDLSTLEALSEDSIVKHTEMLNTNIESTLRTLLESHFKILSKKSKEITK